MNDMFMYLILKIKMIAFQVEGLCGGKIGPTCISGKGLYGL